MAECPLMPVHTRRASEEQEESAGWRTVTHHGVACVIWVQQRRRVCSLPQLVADKVQDMLQDIVILMLLLRADRSDWPPTEAAKWHSVNQLLKWRWKGDSHWYYMA